MSRPAVMKNLRKDTMDALMKLHEMGNSAGDCISLLQTSFIYNSSEHLNDCRIKLVSIMNTEHEIAKGLAELVRDNPALEPYESVSLHLLKIWENIEKLADLIDKKILGGILFSDKAKEEVTFLLQRLIDLLSPSADIILARNEILSNYVQETERGVVRRALEYATLHEERLIEGVCRPSASSLYINMLDAIKSIAWNAKQIAIKLTA